MAECNHEMTEWYRSEYEPSLQHRSCVLCGMSQTARIKAPVIDITDRQPHTLIDAGGKIYVMPTSVLEMVSDRAMSVTSLEDYEHIVPAIISEWLALTKGDQS